MTYDRDMAQRYDAARRLPGETLRLWLNAVAAHVPPQEVGTVLDVGCGTGRFSAALADRFGAQVVGIDPSSHMLAQARENVTHSRVAFGQASAEALPVSRHGADLVFMSMVYHHIADQRAAGREFVRALRPGGWLVVRNATKDLLDQVPYMAFFPEAVDINQHRTPWQRELIETMTECGLSLTSHSVIDQVFAASASEYYDKVSRRGLSDLTRLSDGAFQAGLQRMREAMAREEIAEPVTEPIDLFIFAKET